MREPEVAVRDEVDQLFERAEARLGSDPCAALAELSGALREQAMREERLTALRRASDLPSPEPEDALRRLTLLGDLSKFLEPKGKEQGSAASKSQRDVTKTTSANAVADSCGTMVSIEAGREGGAAGKVASEGEVRQDTHGAIDGHCNDKATCHAKSGMPDTQIPKQAESDSATFNSCPAATKSSARVTQHEAASSSRYNTDYSRFAAVGDDSDAEITGSAEEEHKELERRVASSSGRRSRRLEPKSLTHSAVSTCERKVAKALAVLGARAEGVPCDAAGKSGRLQGLACEAKRLRDLAERVFGPAEVEESIAATDQGRKLLDETVAAPRYSLLDAMD